MSNPIVTIRDCLELARTRLVDRSAQVTDSNWEFKSYLKPESVKPQAANPPPYDDVDSRPQDWVFDWVLHKNGRHGVSSKNYYKYY